MLKIIFIFSLFLWAGQINAKGLNAIETYLSATGSFISKADLEILSKDPRTELNEVLKNKRLSDYIRIRALSAISLFNDTLDKKIIIKEIKSENNSPRIRKYFSRTLVLNFPASFLKKSELNELLSIDLIAKDIKKFRAIRELKRLESLKKRVNKISE